MSRLAALLAVAQQDDHSPAAKSATHAEFRAKGDSQLKNPGAHGFAIAEISDARAGQTGIRRHLHSLVVKGIESPVKRDESVRKLQLPDFPFKRRKVVTSR